MNENAYCQILQKYSGQQILVTGGAGFVGCNLARTLASLGAKVTVLDDLATGSLDNLKSVKDYAFIRGDVRDENLVDNLVAGFDFVFHLAARNIIVSIQNPKDDYSVNIGGTLTLLTALKDSTRLKKFVYASSVSIYGNPYYLPINEDDRINVLSPYSVSKLGGENYTRVFYENYDVPTVIVRYSNVYGDNQSPNNPYCGVIGKFVEKVSRNEAPLIHGDGQQTRDFTYVKDAVDATLLAGLSPKSTGETFNIGTGVETDINSLANTIIGIYGKDLRPEYVDRRDIDNIRRRVLNIEKIRQKLKWVPQYTLQGGLERTIQWYEASKTP